jgi:hypothetical protein
MITPSPESMAVDAGVLHVAKGEAHDRHVMLSADEDAVAAGSAPARARRGSVVARVQGEDVVASS